MSRDRKKKRKESRSNEMKTELEAKIKEAEEVGIKEQTCEQKYKSCMPKRK